VSCYEKGDKATLWDATEGEKAKLRKMGEIRMDKDVNTLSIRLRESYGWHFLELVRLVPDNKVYAGVVLRIGGRSTLSGDDLHDIAALVDDDEAIVSSIIRAARVSMGRPLSGTDLDMAIDSAQRVVSLMNYRKHLGAYLSQKMGTTAPNLAALIGDSVGARLMSKAGSLTNLSKLSASTIQILGAEKALFVCITCAILILEKKDNS
jgi:nucleolar protein 56